MKNASQIIKSIQSKPQFSKLSSFKCINRIKSLFSLPLQKMIKFSYIKNSTLFFVLNHPAGKQEFDNSIKSIKSALNFYMPDECAENLFKDIRAFVTHTPQKATKPFLIKKQFYKERAKGDFSINIEDDKLNSLVKSIQDIIKKHKKA